MHWLKKVTRNKYRRVLAYVVISCIYLFVASGTFFVLEPGANHDDGLQYSQSKSISNGRWLGEYDDVALAKGITYPLWTALLHAIDVPLWLGNALLYMAAALSLIYAIHGFIASKLYLTLAYSLLLFNPFMTVRSYRDIIAPALMLFLLAWVAGIVATVSRRNTEATETTRLWFFTIIGLVALPSWWFLREDSFWFTPFFIAWATVIVAYLFIGRKAMQPVQLRRILVALILPVAATLVSGLLIATANSHHYGRFVVNDYTSKDFSDAYGALTRIKAEKAPANTVPVSYEMRRIAYGVSPAFRELERCLDGGGDCQYYKRRGKVVGDYDGGWFFWALRQAAQEAGYYRSPVAAQRFYESIAYEINGACLAGKISCGPERSALTPVYQSDYTSLIFMKTFDVARYTIVTTDNSGARIVIWPSTATDARREGMAQYLDARYSASELNFGAKLKLKTKELIATGYHFLSPLLVIVALIGTIVATGQLARKWDKGRFALVLFAWSLLFLALLRFVMIAFVDVTSFGALTIEYLGSAYAVVLCFEIIGVWLLIRSLKTGH